MTAVGSSHEGEQQWARTIFNATRKVFSAVHFVVSGSLRFRDVPNRDAKYVMLNILPWRAGVFGTEQVGAFSE
jgi:hypothetical protein